MFEKWIDRVLEKKSKIKELLHLGTEFEYTRIIDETGKSVNPFVPKFDITKINDFNEEIKESQKVRVESPRFIRTLTKALYEVFHKADVDQSGALSYSEFKDAFKNLSYGLNDNDIYTLISLADEDDDGQITWEEFVPIGVEGIKTFYARNQVRENSKETIKEINAEAMENVYYPEIKKAWEILEKDFKKQDIHENGKITIYQLKKVLKSSNLVTPKEINALVRNCSVDEYEYGVNFKQDLFNVRFELAKSQILESNMDHVQKSLIEECKKIDIKHKGKIHINQMNDVLRNSKFIVLSPFQIHMVLGQAELDELRFVNYSNFVIKVKEMIDSVYSLDAISDLADMIASQKVKPEEVEQTYISNLDLFKLFKQYDLNMNGYLELDEYIECLQSQELNLSKEEVVTMSLMADTNGDGKIDYEEFMKHFRDVLDLTRFQRLLNTRESEHQTIKREQTLAQEQAEEEAKRKEDILAI